MLWQPDGGPYGFCHTISPRGGIGGSSLILHIQVFTDMAFMPSGQGSVRGSLDMWSPSRSSMIWLSCLLSTSSILRPLGVWSPFRCSMILLSCLLCKAQFGDHWSPARSTMFNLQSSIFDVQSSMLWLSCLLSTGSVLGPSEMWSPFRSSIMWLLCLLSKGL